MYDIIDISIRPVIDYKFTGLQESLPNFVKAALEASMSLEDLKI